MEYINTISIKEVQKNMANGIKEAKGLYKGSTEAVFICKNGYAIKMLNRAYSRVEIENIDTDYDIFSDTDFCEIYESTNKGNTDFGSCTWTFYNIKTNKGYASIRWYGSSNGYYSEKVDFELYKLDEYELKEYNLIDPTICEIVEKIRDISDIDEDYLIDILNDYNITIKEE